jgi:hypothetical protein
VSIICIKVFPLLKRSVDIRILLKSLILVNTTTENLRGVYWSNWIPARVNICSDSLMITPHFMMISDLTLTLLSVLIDFSKRSAEYVLSR